MILELIVGGLLLGGAVATIITYWNEIVEWVKGVIRRTPNAIYKLVRNPDKEEWWVVVIDWLTGNKEISDPKKGNAEAMYELYKNGKLSIEELADTLSPAEIERLHNKGIMTDEEYRRCLRHSGR